MDTDINKKTLPTNTIGDTKLDIGANHEKFILPKVILVPNPVKSSTDHKTLAATQPLLSNKIPKLTEELVTSKDGFSTDNLTISPTDKKLDFVNLREIVESPDNSCKGYVFLHPLAIKLNSAIASILTIIRGISFKIILDKKLRPELSKICGVGLANNLFIEENGDLSMENINLTYLIISDASVFSKFPQKIKDIIKNNNKIKIVFMATLTSKNMEPAIYKNFLGEDYLSVYISLSHQPSNIDYLPQITFEPRSKEMYIKSLTSTTSNVPNKTKYSSTIVYPQKFWNKTLTSTDNIDLNEGGWLSISALPKIKDWSPKISNLLNYIIASDDDHLIIDDRPEILTLIKTMLSYLDIKCSNVNIEKPTSGIPISSLGKNLGEAKVYLGSSKINTTVLTNNLHFMSIPTIEDWFKILLNVYGPSSSTGFHPDLFKIMFHISGETEIKNYQEFARKISSHEQNFSSLWSKAKPIIYHPLKKYVIYNSR